MKPQTAWHHGARLALDLILLSAGAASGCGLLDEILGRFDAALRGQIIELIAQMRLRPMRVVPASVPIELAAGALDEPEQIIDFIDGDGRRRGTRGGPITQENNCQHHHAYPLHNSLSSGNSDNSLACSL